MSATFNAITTGELDQDSPVTQTLITKLRDNAQAVGFGTDKEWTNPTRADSTNYQNTTDAAMMVYIRGAALTRRDVQVATLSDFSDALEVGSLGGMSSASEPSWASFIVPINHYYRINGAISISEWSELVNA